MSDDDEGVELGQAGSPGWTKFGSPSCSGPGPGSGQSTTGPSLAQHSSEPHRPLSHPHLMSRHILSPSPA